MGDFCSIWDLLLETYSALQFHSFNSNCSLEGFLMLTYPLLRWKCLEVAILPVKDKLWNDNDLNLTMKTLNLEMVLQIFSTSGLILTHSVVSFAKNFWGGLSTCQIEHFDSWVNSPSTTRITLINRRKPLTNRCEERLELGI